MALTPQKRLAQALADPLLAPLLEQHFARVHASYLRHMAREDEVAALLLAGNRATKTARQARGAATGRRQYTNSLAKRLQGAHEPRADAVTLLVSERQRQVLSWALAEALTGAVGDVARGDEETRRLVAMLRPADAAHPCGGQPPSRETATGGAGGPGFLDRPPKRPTC